MKGVRMMLPEPAPAVNATPNQDTAIVLCGGGDPFAEYGRAVDMAREAKRHAVVIAGNDMIGTFPGYIDHAVSLHPDKFKLWLEERMTAGFEPARRIWSHRPFAGITDWTRDWQGSTGLICIKIARELGYTHVVLCGVHMTVEGNHFIRQKPWIAAHGFRRGWTGRIRELKPYVRSFGGWTREQFGEPTVEWLSTDVADMNAYPVRIRGLQA
jgi:hypothetical protein